MSLSRSVSSYFTSSPPPPAGAPPGSGESEIVGSSTAMKRLRQQVRRIGPHFRTVLVSGEAGTGKELVARALHRMSPACEGPLVVRHGAAIAEALAGCEGGASTADDAVRLMKGSVRGTLFLDRISDMSLDMQGRLLRVLTQYELTQSRGNEP